MRGRADASSTRDGHAPLEDRMRTDSLLGSLTDSGWRLGVCAAALQATLLCGCAASPEDPSEPEDSQAPGAVEESQAPAALATPVATHGKLRVVGNQIQDQSGAQVQLKGMSLFWSQWSGSFWNAAVVGSLVDNWHVS